MFCKSLLTFVVFVLWTTTMCHVQPDSPNGVNPELQELRKRWGAEEIIRDLDHIKADVQKISKLQDAGEISTAEALFYFLKMHDFDDNKKLDGHELLAAMGHALEHEQPTQPGMKFPEKEAIVDSFFQYDDNDDGFISYPELRKHLGTEDDKN